MTAAGAIEEKIRSSGRLSALTADAMETMLAGTGLVPERGWSWLAKAVQCALVAAETPSDMSSDRRENCSIRDELFGVAEPLTMAARLLADRSREFDNAVMDAAYQGYAPQGLLDEAPDLRTFAEAVAAVEWLGPFLRRAGMSLEIQGPQWRGSAHLSERVWRAQCLSSLYAKAFDLEPTINSWETAKNRGPWSAFYEAVVVFVYGGRARLNLREVLKAARRLDKVDRVRFGPGILPK